MQHSYMSLSVQFVKIYTKAGWLLCAPKSYKSLWSLWKLNTEFHVLNNFKFSNFQPKCDNDQFINYFFLCLHGFTHSAHSHSQKVVLSLLSFILVINTNCSPFRVPFLLVSPYRRKAWLVHGLLLEVFTEPGLIYITDPRIAL